MNMNVIVRQATPMCLELIQRFEGFKSTPYRCVAGYTSIGYGHEILRGETFLEPISKEEALTLLKKDVIVAELSVCRLISVPLTDGQYDALVDFCYNLGGRRLQISTLRFKLNRKNYLGAADELLRWCYAAGKVWNGLLMRRKAERNLFLV